MVHSIYICRRCDCCIFVQLVVVGFACGDRCAAGGCAHATKREYTKQRKEVLRQCDLYAAKRCTQCTRRAGIHTCHMHACTRTDALPMHMRVRACGLRTAYLYMRTRDVTAAGGCTRTLGLHVDSFCVLLVACVTQAHRHTHSVQDRARIMTQLSDSHRCEHSSGKRAAAQLKRQLRAFAGVRSLLCFVTGRRAVVWCPLWPLCYLACPTWRSLFAPVLYSVGCLGGAVCLYNGLCSLSCAH